MRNLWFGLLAATSLSLGYWAWSSSQSDTNSTSAQAKADAASAERQLYLRLLPGYVAIPQTKCSGTETGIIRIRLSQLLKTLQENKKILRDVSIMNDQIASEKTASVSELISNGTPLERPRQFVSNMLFPTHLDFVTAGKSFDGRPMVQQGKVANVPKPDLDRYVVVRVILDKRINDNTGVEFLHNPRSNVRNNSIFAVMRSENTNINMFCGRKDIVTVEDSDGSLRYVDFGVKSIGQPALGSFGIGLVVDDPNSEYWLPIILDPYVENEG